MMSMASGNCALNFFCRRLRRYRSTMNGSTSTAKQRGDAGIGQLAVKHHGAGKGRDHSDHDNQHQPAEADRQPRLQQKLIEVDQRQSIVAATGEPALAPQLHQHAFAVCLVVHHLETAVDVLAVGGVVVEATGKRRSANIAAETPIRR